MTPFSTLLRRHREAKRWSQETLAKRSHLDHSLVSRLESGHRNPTENSICHLTRALGLSGEPADALWLAAGMVPPDLDAQLLGRLIAFLREAQATSATERAA